jgi:5-(carboxyamino)imidazole ribonucleotide mutase
VAINGAKNAGILAAQIIGINDNAIKEKIKKYKQNLKEEVLLKDKKIQAEVF